MFFESVTDDGIVAKWALLLHSRVRYRKCTHNTFLYELPNCSGWPVIAIGSTLIALKSLARPPTMASDHCDSASMWTLLLDMPIWGHYQPLVHVRQEWIYLGSLYCLYSNQNILWTTQLDINLNEGRSHSAKWRWVSMGNWALVTIPTRGGPEEPRTLIGQTFSVSSTFNFKLVRSACNVNVIIELED